MILMPYTNMTVFCWVRLESKFLRTNALFGIYSHSTCRCYRAKRCFKPDNPISCSIWILFPIQSCENQAVLYLQDHILVCVFGDANSPLIGLQDFVMPLRATNLLYHELKDIVLLGPLEYLQREWKFIQNFPKLWLFSVSIFWMLFLPLPPFLQQSCALLKTFEKCLLMRGLIQK